MLVRIGVFRVCTSRPDLTGETGEVAYRKRNYCARGFNQRDARENEAYETALSLLYLSLSLSREDVVISLVSLINLMLGIGHSAIVVLAIAFARAPQEI